MTSILALDISMRTGAAWRDNSGAVQFITRDFTDYKHDYAALALRFEAWLATVFTELEPALLAFEAPFFSKGSPQVAKVLHGMCWEAEKMAFKRNVPRVQKQATSIKKFITGNGRADKQEVMAAVRAKGHMVQDDHQGDSVALLLMVENEF